MTKLYEHFIVLLLLKVAISAAWLQDCFASSGKRCMKKDEVGGFSVFMADGDPCFTYSGNRWCFVSGQGHLHGCECTPECGCKGTADVEPTPTCDNSNVPTVFDIKCDDVTGTTNTMCTYKGIGSKCNGKVCVYGLTDQQKQDVVEKHNDLRRRVATGQEIRGVGGFGQPMAANMEELVWDEDLAVVAQRWTDQCQSGHDVDRSTPEMNPVGQNFAMTGSTANTGAEAQMADFVQMWYDEVDDFNAATLEVSSSGHTGVVGHYTQVVWATTKKVGCGYIQFQKDSWYYRHLVCNYYPAGNFLGQAVYVKGDAGTQCPGGISSDGLCV